jgi:alpha-beta hydrolase superfamily lysophospholipase
MREYAARYREFGEWLVSKGFAVGINDHAGHGDSIKDSRGYFGEKDGPSNMVLDMHELSVRLKQECPRLPFFLLGHSMGSFLARLYTSKFGNELDGAVYSGTGEAPPPLPVALVLASILSRGKGSRDEAKLLNNLSSIGYNDKFKPNRTISDWLTKDEAKVDAFIKEPKAQFTFTNRGYYDLFSMLSDVSKADWAKSLPKDLPVLFISGSEDPVGAYGKGVFKVFRSLVDAGLTDVELKLYGAGRHEMLNETNRVDVYSDLHHWALARMNRM